MTKYQLSFLVSLKLKAEQINQYQEKIIRQIKEIGAEVENISETREQVLAYSIKEERKVWLVNLTLRSEPSKINQIKSFLEKEDLILRSMISAIPRERPWSALRRPSSRKKEGVLAGAAAEEKPKVEKNLDQKINEILNWE